MMGILDWIRGGKRDELDKKKIKYLEELVEDLSAKLALDFHEAVAGIKELDAGKLYYMHVEGGEDEVERALEMFRRAQKSIPWKLPCIIVGSKEITELKVGELKKVVEEAEKHEK